MTFYSVFVNLRKSCDLDCFTITNLNEINQKLLEKCHELLTYNEIVLSWIPSHIGIQGNEMVDQQAKTSLSLNQLLLRFHFLILSHLSINISWKNGKLHGITALEINFLTSNQLLVNINQLFETLEEKK